ncbi:MAG: L-threonylcarbamoyladenylate synthase [Clostridia bacterium]|nr:L-threonylcarbamoyladenylate synthase [Clostridia bacterium]
MNTRVLPPTPQAIHEAALALQSGELVGIPTETVYGLGANALDETAVRKIFAAKGRPADNPLIVHVARLEDAAPLCEISDTARALAARFCPGPLTIILPRRSIVPDVVTAGLDTVAVRVPSHPVAQALLHECGLPIAAPSANTSGKPSPTTALHVYHDLNGKLPIILDGGECQVGLESTVISLSGDLPTVLRPGGVTPEMLLEVLTEVRVADSVLRPLQAGEKALSPGMMYKHYAPGGVLTMVKGTQEKVQHVCRRLYSAAVADGQTACILAFEEHLAAYSGMEVLSIGRLTEPETVSHRLFAVLRQLDEQGTDRMFSEVLPAKGLGLAIMNRLSRAAGFRTIDADQEEEDPSCPSRESSSRS